MTDVKAQPHKTKEERKILRLERRLQLRMEELNRLKVAIARIGLMSDDADARAVANDALFNTDEYTKELMSIPNLQTSASDILGD